jgi:excisionase family DNA binding protein
MKKSELARELGVSEVTIWRWEKSGKLKEKIKEMKEKSLQSNANVLHSEIESLQSITNVLQNVINELQKISNAIQSNTNVIQKISVQLNEMNSLLQRTALQGESQNAIKSITSKIPEKKIWDYGIESFTTSQLAKILGVSTTTIQRWVGRGKLKAVKTATGYVIPKEEALKLIFKKVYDEVNLTTNAGDSVSIKAFKDTLRKYINLPEEEINSILLSLDKNEVLYIQTANSPGEFTEEEKKAAIKSEDGRVLFYITWVEK